MPSTVTEAFAAAGLAPHGAVPWGTPLPEREPGLYVVALTSSAADSQAACAEAPLAHERFEHLLSLRPELLLDGTRPDADELATRIASFWLPDEVVLYVGLAGQPLRTRVRQYYNTPLGARKPHAGGWWLKTLANLDELWVHYAATPGYVDAEVAMLRAFADAVAPSSRERLPDRERIAPYANLRTSTGRIKRHGITGATGDRPDATALTDA
jgi:hypothetical protein